MIAFRKFKYQLDEKYCANVGILGQDVESKSGFIRLFSDGNLVLDRAYGWDGSSGPTWDTKT